MVMNKDTRYGAGDITFNMNVSWLTDMLYNLPGYTEKEHDDDDKYYEDMVKIEKLIGDYMDGCINDEKLYQDGDAIDYVLNDVVGYRIIEKWYEICD